MITLNKKLLLASNSPRRKQLLEQMGFEFEVIKIQTDESHSGLNASEVAGFLAHKKAEAFGNLPDDTLLICADTVVVVQDQVLGKPENLTEAVGMLKTLSGSFHEVYTSLCVRTRSTTQVETDVARVKFASLSEEMIQYYIQNCQPFDKAGAYGIQEWIGMVGIERIEGSFYTIMGLPTHRLFPLLQPYIISY